MSPALTMFEVTPDHPVPISPQGGTATITVLSGDTLYYADNQQVSAAHNQGSVTAGNVQSFTNPAWVRSASLSTVLAQVTAPSPVLAPGTVASGSQTSPILFLDSFNAKGDGVTDDSTALQNAAAAASNIGANTGSKCPLYLTPGKTYLVSEHIPQSWMEIWGYGAQLKRNPTYTGSLIFSHPGLGVGSPLNRFGMRGVTLAPGSGTETAHFVAINQASGLVFEDCYASNLGASALYLSDSQYMWVNRNRFPLCGMVPAGTNAINLCDSGNGDTTPLKHVWVTNNYVTSLNFCLDFVVSGTPNRTDPEVSAHVLGNTLITPSNANGQSCPLGFERQGSNIAISGFEFLGNHIYRLNDSATSDYAFQCSAQSGNTDPNGISGVTIAGGKIVNQTAHGVGLLLGASYSTVQGVEFDCAINDVVLYAHGATGLGHNVVGPFTGHRGSGDSIAALGSGIDFTTTTLFPAL